MEGYVSWPPRSNDLFLYGNTFWTIYGSLRHYIGPKTPKYCNIRASFLNHIASILSERGLTYGAVIPCIITLPLGPSGMHSVIYSPQHNCVFTLVCLATLIYIQNYTTRLYLMFFKPTDLSLFWRISMLCCFIPRSENKGLFPCIELQVGWD